jgi:hypothetical protein
MVCALAFPSSADFRYHSTAAAMSCFTPLPVSKSTAIAFCASVFPASAACLKNLNANSGLFATPNPFM